MTISSSGALRKSKAPSAVGNLKLDQKHTNDLLYGAAIGDALGVPYEFKERGSFVCDGMDGFGSHNQEAGSWSDDTSLLIATVDSLRSCDRIDTEDMRRRFSRWLNRGDYAIGKRVFDVGGTTANAIRSGVGCDGERDNGNGSLMRILPLALTDCADDDIRAVSAITHAHEISTDACVTLVHFARSVLSGATEIPNIEFSEVRSTGFVLDTLKASIWCFVTTHSYRECVLKAVNLGGDTDTTACIAGGLAGMKYGFYGPYGIPSDWYRQLRGRPIIESVL